MPCRSTGDVEVYVYLFLTCAIEELHAPAILTSGKSPHTQSMRGWVGPRADLHGYGEEKILFLCVEFHIY
jgi:hypothetical protein